MRSHRAGVSIPILIIAVGVGWLLTFQGIGPGINWVWTLALGVIGVLTFVINGFNKVSIVVGPFFILASLLSILRQDGNLSLELKVPILVITVGVLLLITQLPIIPKPEWLEPLPTTTSETEASSPVPKKLRLGDSGAGNPGNIENS